MSLLVLECSVHWSKRSLRGLLTRSLQINSSYFSETNVKAYILQIQKFDINVGLSRGKTRLYLSPALARW